MPTAVVKKSDLFSQSSKNNAVIDPSEVEATPDPRIKFGVQGVGSNIYGPYAVEDRNRQRLLNAREVAAELGVSERFVRDHTTRRAPKIRAIRMGTLIRYMQADVDAFMEELGTSPTSRPA